jgi:hypothetical protein
MILPWILSDLLRRNNTHTLPMFPSNRKGRNTDNLFLWSQYYIHLKMGQGYNKKNRELHVNLFNEHR